MRSSKLIKNATSPDRRRRRTLLLRTRLHDRFSKEYDRWTNVETALRRSLDQRSMHAIVRRRHPFLREAASR